MSTGVDSSVYDLAESFLEDIGISEATRVQELAVLIQDTIESHLRMLEDGYDVCPKHGAHHKGECLCCAITRDAALEPLEQLIDRTGGQVCAHGIRPAGMRCLACEMEVK